MHGYAAIVNHLPEKYQGDFFRSPFPEKDFVNSTVAEILPVCSILSFPLPFCPFLDISRGSSYAAGGLPA